MEANLDLLWLPGQGEALPALPAFRQKAAREGILVSLIRGEGPNPLETIRRHLALGLPPPLIAVMVRAIKGKTREWSEAMIRHAGCPLTMVSFRAS